MSSPQLGVTLSLEDEWHGMLNAHVTSSGFSGEGSAWFSVIPIRGFLHECRAFPLSMEHPPILEGGFYSAVHRGALEHVMVGIRVSQFDIRGRLLVRTTLATDGGEPSDRTLQHTVTARFLTDHAALDTFCRNLGWLLQGGDGQAVLHGT